MVGSEGTLGVVLEATVKLVPLPKAKAVMAIEFADAAGGARGGAADPPPPAVGRRGDGQVHPRLHEAERRAAAPAADVHRRRSGSAPLRGVLRRRRRASCRRGCRRSKRDLRVARTTATDTSTRWTWPRRRSIWSVREAGLGLSMAMKDDNKSLSFVEDTAVAPERLRDFIDRFLADRPARTARRPASTRMRRSAACTCGRSST